MAHFIWNTIYTAKLETSITFYTEILGLNVERQFTSPVGVTYVFMSDKKGFEIELIHDPKKDEVASAPTNLSMGYQVDHLETYLSKANENGYETQGEIISAPSIRFAFIKDPNGVTVQLAERD